MPYIKQARRAEINPGVFGGLDFQGNEITDDWFIDRSAIKTAGELNFAFSLLAKSYLDNTEYSYAKMNDVVGALEGAKLEFYRRVAAPYEDEKIKENGDVY